MGYLLLYIAIHLALILFPIGGTYNTFRSGAHASERNFSYAFFIDIIGCIILGPFLNDWAAVKNATYQYGQEVKGQHITISEVNGLLWYMNQEKPLGKWIRKGLHFFDPFHVQKAIGARYPKDFKIPLWWKILRAFVITIALAVMVYFDYRLFVFIRKLYVLYTVYG